MLLRICILSLIFFLQSYNLYSQPLSQTIRGRVTDFDTGLPLFGANIFIVDSAINLGAISDEKGFFAIKNLPLGRKNIRISFIGYEEQFIKSIELVSGKETNLNISLKPIVIISSEATVIARQRKGESINEMASVSARPFTVEETSRYAGNWGDPSRMASKYAGVTVISDKRNDIIIRGNSPAGVLWRLEDIDIPNPNHFSIAGSSGGAISMINNNLLDNSDFYTGAFPAEYGNAVAGVFDLKLRNGNSHKHEYIAQVGVQGFELGAEGPFSTKNNSSYLINYRYSTLAVLDKFGISIIDALPKFQDLSFKLNFPVKKGTISLFGMGGKSIAQSFADKDSLLWQKNGSRFGNISGAEAGIIALSYNRAIGANTHFKLILSSSANRPFFSNDSLNSNYESFLLDDFSFLEGRHSAKIILHHRFSSRSRLRSGLTASNMYFNSKAETYLYNPNKIARPISKFEGSTGLIQAFTQWQYVLYKGISLNAGLHSMWFLLNQTQSLEPRIGLKLPVSGKSAFSLGAGIHKQTQALPVYFTEEYKPDGTATYPNKKLNFLTSNQIIGGFDHFFNEHLRLKIELYKQWINNASISESNPSFSLVNFAGGDNLFNTGKLISEGTGNNTGAEITMEQFLRKNFYFLVSLSLFDSKYKGFDNIERDTRFNGNYAANALAGKDFKIGKSNNRIVGINFTYVAIGGQRYTPINLLASQTAGYELRYDSLAYTKQFPPFIRFDIRIRYRENYKKWSHEIAFELGNVFNRTNYEEYYYHNPSQTIRFNKNLQRIPIVFYRLEF